MSVGTHIAMGLAFGPLILPFVIFVFVEKLRYAVVLGFGLYCVVFSGCCFVLLEVLLKLLLVSCTVYLAVVVGNNRRRTQYYICTI